ncbi:hypothetical protein C8J23_10481 [Shewanella chilikensis]|uniref:Uncharacterized protein n=1 Tax=Shewanella chilikensis TaxID=558541 RepID=A0ABX5PRT7_9GAMM|nr:hypothetical protein C8J23_10481 [Shewanella chilikensis]
MITYLSALTEETLISFKGNRVWQDISKGFENVPCVFFFLFFGD